MRIQEEKQRVSLTVRDALDVWCCCALGEVGSGSDEYVLWILRGSGTESLVVPFLFFSGDLFFFERGLGRCKALIL